MVLQQKTVDCALQLKSELLPQSKEIRYLGVLFRHEGEMEALDGQAYCCVSSNAGVGLAYCGPSFSLHGYVIVVVFAVIYFRLFFMLLRG